MAGNPSGQPVTAADVHRSLEAAARSIADIVNVFEDLDLDRVLMGEGKRPEPIPDPPRLTSKCMRPVWDGGVEIWVGDVRKALAEIEDWVVDLAEAFEGLDPGIVLGHGSHSL